MLFLVGSHMSTSASEPKRVILLLHAGNLVKSGGEERTIMRVVAAIGKLEVTLQYEGANTPPLALASMEQLSVSLNVHPSTLALKGSLGNLRATDAMLPEVTGLLPLCHSATALIYLQHQQLCIYFSCRLLDRAFSGVRLEF